MTQTRPILYSFRRCPYAMRARMGLLEAGIEVELREVVLRDKPADMLAASPKGTVPVLVFPDGRVLEESLEVMKWALEQSDVRGFLKAEPEEQCALVDDMDARFKPHLDRYKYPNRYRDEPPADHRGTGLEWIAEHLATRLQKAPYLFGETVGFADVASFPFIRQFAHVDRDWFYATAPETVCEWLRAHLASDRFAHIMAKYPQWQPGAPSIVFP